MSKGHKKSLRSSRNKRSGKYAKQRMRTEANKLKRKRKLPFSIYIIISLCIIVITNLNERLYDGKNRNNTKSNEAE